MSHTATCSWDGSHATKRGFRLDYFRDVLLAVGRAKGQAEMEGLLREQGLVPAALMDTEVWLSPEQGHALLSGAADSLGGDEALERVERWLSDHWAVAELPVDGLKDLAALGAFVVAGNGKTDSEGVWSLAGSGWGRARLVYRGPNEADERLCAQRRAHLKLLARAAGIEGMQLRHRTCRAKGEAACVYELRRPWGALRAAEWWGIAVLVLGTLVLFDAKAFRPGLGSMAAALAALLAGHYLMNSRHRRMAQLHERDRRLLLQAGRLSSQRQGYLDRIRRLLAEESQSAQAVFNHSGQLEHINSRFEQLFGLATVQLKDAGDFVRWLGPRPWTGRRTVEWGGKGHVLDLRELEMADASGQTEALLLQVDEPGRIQRAHRDAESGAALLEALVLNGQDAVLLMDQAGRCSFATENMERLFGHRASELSNTDFAALLDPSDASAFRSVLAGMGQGSGAQMRLRLRHRSAGWRWVQVNILDRRAVPALGGYLVELRDVTSQMESEAALRVSEDSLRRNEQFFRMIIESSIDLVLLLDERRRLLFVNPALSALLGYRATEVLGRDLLDIIEAEDRAAVAERFEFARVQDDGWTSVKLHVRHKDGSLRHFEARGRRAQDPEGKPVIVVGARDISRETELMDKALQENRLEAVGRLAGGVAHDFNNLLTVILGHTELALGEVEADSPMSERLEQIHEASIRASELVAQLLAFGRKQVLEPRRLELNELVRKNVGFIERVLGPQSKVSVQYSEEPVFIQAEPISLARAILNLASNARDAMPDGGNLRVEVYRGAGRDAQAVLSVIDNGLGMSNEVRARIFEPYFTTRGQGNGLGLSLVFGTMQQLGGSVEVRSEPGQGSRFDLHFPVVEDTEVDGGDAQARPETQAQAVRGDGFSVLLVDDDANVRRLAAEGLRVHGYDVIEAANGEEALALWREARYHRHPIDLLLTDIVMPRMSGIQLADQIVREEPKQPVLLFSGFFDSESIPAESILFPVLRKPFTIDHLLENVQKALRSA